MHILIVKLGALGDVVRTSYFARALKEHWGDGLRITWLTAPSSAPLLQFNPWIDRIFTSIGECNGTAYDRIYSLDDERETLIGVASLRASGVTGAYIENGSPTYSLDAAAWFDMGLLSRFGKQRADTKKKKRTAGVMRRFFARYLA